MSYACTLAKLGHTVKDDTRHNNCNLVLHWTDTSLNEWTTTVYRRRHQVFGEQLDYFNCPRDSILKRIWKGKEGIYAKEH
jgi:hypothetical protein